MHRTELHAGTMGLLLIIAVGNLSGERPSHDRDEATHESGRVEAAIDTIVPVEFREPPELSIGVREGNPVEEFYRLSPPWMMEDGSVIVPVRGVNEIRIFGANGRFLRAMGGSGDGPGEFRTLSGAWSRGDTIEAWGLGAGRVTRFLPNGVIETVPIRPDPDDDVLSSIGAASFVGATREGWLLLTVASTSLEEGVRDQLTVHHFGRSGQLLAGRVVAIEGMDRGDMGNFTGPHPLSPAARFAYLARDDELYVAETLGARISATDSYGRPIRTIEWEPDRLWSPREAFDLVVRVVESGREEPFRVRDGIPYPTGWQRVTSPPAAVPVFSDFLVDDEGLVWIRPFVPERDAAALGGNVALWRSGPGGRWMILSRDGERLGEIDVPDGFEPYQVMSDKVLGIYRDELGVEFVRIYALTRR